MHLNNVHLPRPMTHDLMLTFLKSVNAKISKVVITELKESTFYASIYVEQDGTVQEIDARPSDSIALALRASSPLFVDESVFDQCEPLLKPISKDEVEDFRKKLSDLKPEDIYKDIKKPPEDKP